MNTHIPNRRGTMLRRIQAVLEEEQYRWLRNEAERRGVSVSALIREAIETLRAHQAWRPLDESPFWELVGAGRSDQKGPAISEHVDDWVYPLPPHRRPRSRRSRSRA
jgi:hypothetical protein